MDATEHGLRSSEHGKEATADKGRPAERLTAMEMPQPVVLVVGDDQSYFSEQVWDGVVQANSAASESEPITWAELAPLLDAPLRDIQRSLEQHGWSRMKRPRVRRPVPLQMQHAHEPDPRQLKDDLRKVIDLFDVWAIIASGSAGDVQPLRNALSGIDVPLLVTTDSTTVSASDHRPNELRLMPSNQAQATAMLFIAIQANSTKQVDDQGNGTSQEDGRSHAASPLREKPEIAYSCDDSPQAREYVNDLRRQLQREAQRLAGLRLQEYDARRDNLGPVIGIGYTAHALKLIAERSSRRLTILSDGCATREVSDAVKEQRKDDKRYWLVARGVEHEELGKKSFSAVREAGLRLLEWDSTDPSAKDRQQKSLRDLIKEILAADEAHFNFNGIENVAPAYRVSPILEEENLGTPPRDRTTTRPAQSHGHLRIVG